MRYNHLKIGMDDVGSIMELTSSLAWADVIHANFQRVISHYIQSISTCLSCGAQRGLKTIFIQKSRSRYMNIYPAKSSWFESACFASVMIDDVGCSQRHQCPQCDQYCVQYLYYCHKGAADIALCNWNKWMSNVICTQCIISMVL